MTAHICENRITLSEDHNYSQADRRKFNNATDDAIQEKFDLKCF